MKPLSPQELSEIIDLLVESTDYVELKESALVFVLPILEKEIVLKDVKGEREENRYSVSGSTSIENHQLKGVLGFSDSKNWSIALDCSALNLNGVELLRQWFGTDLSNAYFKPDNFKIQSITFDSRKHAFEIFFQLWEANWVISINEEGFELSATFVDAKHVEDFLNAEIVNLIGSSGFNDTLKFRIKEFGCHFKEHKGGISFSNQSIALYLDVVDAQLKACYSGNIGTGDIADFLSKYAPISLDGLKLPNLQFTLTELNFEQPESQLKLQGEWEQNDFKAKSSLAFDWSEKKVDFSCHTLQGGLSLSTLLENVFGISLGEIPVLSNLLESRIADCESNVNLEQKTVELLHRGLFLGKFEAAFVLEIKECGVHARLAFGSSNFSLQELLKIFGLTVSDYLPSLELVLSFIDIDTASHKFYILAHESNNPDNIVAVDIRYNEGLNARIRMACAENKTFSEKELLPNRLVQALKDQKTSDFFGKLKDQILACRFNQFDFNLKTKSKEASFEVKGELLSYKSLSLFGFNWVESKPKFYLKITPDEGQVFNLRKFILDHTDQFDDMVIMVPDLAVQLKSFELNQIKKHFLIDTQLEFSNTGFRSNFELRLGDEKGVTFKLGSLDNKAVPFNALYGLLPKGTPQIPQILPDGLHKTIVHSGISSLGFVKNVANPKIEFNCKGELSHIDEDSIFFTFYFEEVNKSHCEFISDFKGTKLDTGHFCNWFGLDKSLLPPVTFELSEARFRKEGANDTVSGLIDSELTIAKVPFHFKAERKKDDEGWKFIGTAANKQEKTLKAFIKEAVKVELPDIFPDLTIDKCEIIADLGKKEFSFLIRDMFFAKLYFNVKVIHDKKGWHLFIDSKNPDNTTLRTFFKALTNVDPPKGFPDATIGSCQLTIEKGVAEFKFKELKFGGLEGDISVKKDAEGWLFEGGLKNPDHVNSRQFVEELIQIKLPSELPSVTISTADIKLRTGPSGSLLFDATLVEPVDNGADELTKLFSKVERLLVHFSKQEQYVQLEGGEVGILSTSYFDPHYGKDRKLCISLMLTKLELKKSEGMAFSGEAKLNFKNLPYPLDKAFRPDLTFGVSFDSKKKELVFKVKDVIKEELARIPDLGKYLIEQAKRAGLQNSDFPEGLRIPEMGEAYIQITELGIALGKDITANIELSLGLPSQLNEVFKVPKGHKVIKTYNPSGKTDKEKNLLTGSISIATTGIRGRIEQWPFELKGLDQKKDGLKVDFNKLFGLKAFPSPLILTKPEIRADLKKMSFGFKGGYEVAEKNKGLCLPTTFIKGLFESLNKEALGSAFDVEGLIDVFPNEIPITQIKLFDYETKKLDLKAFQEHFALFGLPFPAAVAELCELVKNNTDQLPDRFKEYLNIELPDEIYSEFDVTSDGGFSFGISTYKDSRDNSTTPLKMLIPGGMPGLMGIKLYRLAIGAALGGSAIKVELDVEFDMFNFAELAAACIKNTPFTEESDYLPPANQLGQHGVIKNLITYVFYQAYVPLPVPVFVEKLEIATYDITGFKSHFNIDLDISSFSIVEALKSALEFKTILLGADDEVNPTNYTPLKRYLRKEEKGVVSYEEVPDESRPQAKSSGNAFGAYIGPIYAQLPKFMGDQKMTFPSGEEIHFNAIRIGSGRGKDGQDYVYKIQPFELGKTLLHGLRKPSINYIIKSVDLKDRMGDVNICFFKVYNIHLNWLLSTPKEFREEAYPLLMQAADTHSIQSSPDQILELLVRDDSGIANEVDEEGFIGLARGYWNLADFVQAELTAGLLLGKESGAKMGLSYQGKIGEIIQFLLSGSIAISPQGTDKVAIEGKGYFKLFSREIIYANYRFTERGFDFLGFLDLFPEQWPFKVQGFLQGHLDDKYFLFHGSTQLLFGNSGIQSYVLLKAENIQGHQNGQSQLAENTTKSFQKRINDGVLLYDVALKNDVVFYYGFKFDLASLDLLLKASIEEGIARMSFETHLKALGFLELRGQTDIEFNFESGLVFEGDYLIKAQYDHFHILNLRAYTSAELNPQSGKFALTGELVPGSWVLSPDFKTSGGLAYVNWLVGEHAGDFVLTVGGYHPDFIKPAHYPDVKRLRLNWQLDSYTAFDGEAYFALTPACIMAGGLLNFRYARGGVSAGFSAHAHFITSWNAFFFHLSIGVSVYASYTLTIKVLSWRVSKTFSINVGARLEIWGAPVGGCVDINLKVVRLRIPFGEGRPEFGPISEDSFLNMLPKAENGKPELHKVSFLQGVEEIKGEHVFIRPEDFSILIKSAAPLEGIYINGEDDAKGDKVNVRPMRKKQVDSRLDISLDDNFKCKVEKIEHAVPDALWGDFEYEGLNREPLIRDQLVGIKITAKETKLNGLLTLTENDLNPVPIDHGKTLSIDLQGWKTKVLHPDDGLNEAKLKSRQNRALIEDLERIGIDLGFEVGIDFATPKFDRHIEVWYEDFPLRK